MRPLAAVLVAFAILAAPAAAAANPWLDERVLNIAHQGGEAEFPSNTLYAFRKAVRAGADMLELDVNRTRDGKLVVMHDWTVDRTTNGSGYLTDLTLAQVRRLDAAHFFVPGRNAVAGLPPRRYPLRGVRTGERRPPRGFARRDFRVPTLGEVLRAFPHTPVTIEIKGRDDEPAEFLRGAELLAAELERFRRGDLIVASFNQAAVDRFRALQPRVDVAPGVDGIAAFLLGGGSPGAGVAALQIPVTYTLGGQQIAVTTPESVLAAHEAGYAVHVWLSGSEESRRVYDRLLDMCVDGIMAARPRALERLLRRRGVARPGARRGTDPCGAEASAAALAPTGGLRIAVRRRGLGPQEQRGTVVVRRRGRVVARGPFGLEAGESRHEWVLPPAGARARRGARVVAVVRTRGAAGDPVRTRLRVR